MDGGAQLTFSFLLSPGPWMMPHTVRMSVTPQLTQSRNSPQEYPEVCLLQIGPVKLTILINHQVP